MRFGTIKSQKILANASNTLYFSWDQTIQTNYYYWTNWVYLAALG